MGEILNIKKEKRERERETKCKQRINILLWWTKAIYNLAQHKASIEDDAILVICHGYDSSDNKNWI